MNRRRPPGPYGSEWVIVWGMFLLTLACMVIALAVAIKPASAGNVLIFDGSGNLLMQCEDPMRIEPTAGAIICDTPRLIYENGFEEP